MPSANSICFSKKKSSSIARIHLEIGAIIPLRIERLSYDGGRGVGRFENFVFFVPFTAPGDEIEARIVDLKKNFGVAELVSLTHASPARRTPPCPVFGRCGGCTWQHISYEEQLRQKQQTLAYAIRGLWPQDRELPPIVPSPKELRYRNRIQLQVQDGRFGFFATGTNAMVAIDDCLIADERLMQNLPLGDFSRAKKIELALDAGGHRQTRDVSSGGGEFTQVNSEINEKLKALVTAALTAEAPPVVYDLYCGQGNLSFQILEALPAARLVGVEVNKSAVALARSTSRFAARREFVTQDVEQFLRHTQKIEAEAAFVLDPPRAGLGAVCTETLRLRPRTLIYVSCNLGTLPRDLQKLTAAYEIESVQGLDMFPQTEYLETVVVLRARPGS